MGYVKVSIPLEHKMSNGKFVAENDEVYGIIVETNVLWLKKCYIDGEPEISDNFTCWIKEWYIRKRGLDAWIDTSHEPMLF